MPERQGASRWTGLWITLAAIVVSAALTLAVPTPVPIKGVLYALPLSAVVYASFLGRVPTALASTTLSSIYAVVHYDALDAIFPRRSDRLLLGGAVVIVTFGMSWVALRIRRRHDELADRALQAEHAHAADLERANTALTQANRTLEAFTYVVSHDLKEPARALGELTRSLQEDHAHALDEEGKDLVRRSVGSSLRLQTLLNGLLDYSRAAQIQPHEFQDIRIEDALADPECLTRYERVLNERNGRLGSQPGPSVRASMTGLCQLLGNLILNSFKHNPRPDPRVSVGSHPSEEDPRWVDVVIEDNGPGYPDALIEQFNRAPRGRPATLRGGFGLIIAREAVEKMGGRMRLSKASGGGARTIVTLPAGAADDAEPLAKKRPGRGAKIVPP